mgnify:CR=1 FL=1
MYNPLQSGMKKRWQAICGGLVLFLTGSVNANECLNLMPYDTVADGLPHICQSSFNGVENSYSCQDYRFNNTRYRVLYRGGVTPKAVIELTRNDNYYLLSAPLFGDERLRCPLKPPAGIPQHATHRGTGVCYDENDEMVACSVFEHAAARETEAHRFMTFYHPSSEQPVTIDAQIAGNNEDALVAEIAFQIGMSLWDSECCTEQAVDYLAYAYRLFPRNDLYKTAYRRSRATLELQALSQGPRGQTRFD